MPATAQTTTRGATAGAPKAPGASGAAPAGDHLPTTCPKALERLPAWLVWNYEPGEGLLGKPRKVPCYALSGRRRHGTQGSAADRAGLVDFATACRMARADWHQGVGLALLPGMNITALDFDNCTDARGNPLPEVERLVSGTYAEISPSGRGVRAFFLGDLGDLGDRKDNPKGKGALFGFETFCTKGFVTFTGNTLDFDGGDPVAPVTQEVRDYCAQRFGIRSASASSRAESGPDDDDDPLGHSAPLGLTEARMREDLDVLPPDMGYADWLAIGMALHHETGGEGFGLWLEWSAGGSKFPGEEVLQRHWDSFGPRPGADPVTARTLIHMANRHRASLGVALAGFPPVTDADGVPLPPPFELGNRGAILATIGNVVMALARPDVCGAALAWDTFRDRLMVAARPGQWRLFRDTDLTVLRMRLALQGFRPIPREMIRDAVDKVAEDARFDSAQTWLDGLQWDGVPRVERFAVDCLGAVDTPYTRAVSLYLWTALAGRVMQPGCKADMAPVLVGAQGAGKSQAVATMAPGTEFFCEVSLHEKDDNLSRKMRGVLVAEIAELAGLRARDLESLKTFMSRTFEEWTPKFKEQPVRYDRRLVFVGTTNDDRFLTDTTGNRRWLPIRGGEVQPMDVARIKRERDQLWAEARELHAVQGVAWREAERQARAVLDEFMVTDPWEETVRQWLATPDTLTGEAPQSRQHLTTGMVLGEALRLPAGQATRAHEIKAGQVLKSLGFVRIRASVDGARPWVYTRPEV